MPNVKMPTIIGILTFMGRKISCSAEFFAAVRKESLQTTDVTFSGSCELSQPMGKTEFSSTAKNRTNSVSLVRTHTATILTSSVAYPLIP